MATYPKFYYPYINNPYKAESCLNRTFCLVLRGFGLDGLTVYILSPCKHVLLTIYVYVYCHRDTNSYQLNTNKTHS